MSAALKYSLCVGAGIVVELFAFAAATLMTFAGCRSAPLPAEFSFIFPFQAVVPKALSDTGLGIIIMCATLLQMPIYGVIIARGWTKGKFEEYALYLFS